MFSLLKRLAKCLAANKLLLQNKKKYFKKFLKILPLMEKNIYWVVKALAECLLKVILLEFFAFCNPNICTRCTFASYSRFSFHFPITSFCLYICFISAQNVDKINVEILPQKASFTTSIPRSSSVLSAITLHCIQDPIGRKEIEDMD